MRGVKVSLKDAEAAKEFLLKKGLLDFTHVPIKHKDFMVFPVLKDFKGKYRVEEFEFTEKPEKENWKTHLQHVLTGDEYDSLITAHDVVGTIAIMEIPEGLEKKEGLIGEALLESNNNIHTILKKAGDHSGVFRTQKLAWLAGEKTKETLHKENHVRLKLNVEEVYFSTRLSTERKRIMEMIKPKEEILVMFSGCAPYPCVIAKNTECENVLGIELNPIAHDYAMVNVALNKLKNVELIHGDVKKEVPKLKKKFDRIIMPLPRTADEFLSVALKAAKKGTIIHLYDFLHETEFGTTENKVKAICKQAGMKEKVLEFVKCGQYSPGKFRVCLDFKITS